MNTKNTLIAIALLLLLGAGVYFISGKKTEAPTTPNPSSSNELTVKGVLVPGGVECQRLQTIEGTYYTLTRNSFGTDIKEGDQVEVTGTPAEVSFCQQDITLNVTKIEKLNTGGQSNTTPNPSSNPATKSTNSGVSGTVMVSANCGTVPEPPSDTCDNKPYQATIIVKNVAGAEVTRVTSDISGIFQMTLVPGEYILHPVSGDPEPHAQDIPITVEANKFSKVVIVYQYSMFAQ
jgi:hypothetical protein